MAAQGNKSTINIHPCTANVRQELKVSLDTNKRLGTTHSANRKRLAILRAASALSILFVWESWKGDAFALYMQRDICFLVCRNT